MRRVLTTVAMWFIQWQAYAATGYLEQMESRGREVAKTEFGLDKVTSEMLSVYEKLSAFNQKRKLLGSAPKCLDR